MIDFEVDPNLESSKSKFEDTKKPNGFDYDADAQTKLDEELIKVLKHIAYSSEAGYKFKLQRAGLIIKYKRDLFTINALYQEAVREYKEYQKTLNNSPRQTNDKPALQGETLEWSDIEPYKDPVNGSELLDDIVREGQQYIVFPNLAYAHGVALWVMACYTFDVWTVFPRLRIKASDPNCGKSTLMDFISFLVPKPLEADNPTISPIFRSIAEHRPTLLLDEADTYLRTNLEMRGILNSGHHKRNGVIRSVGEDHEITGGHCWRMLT